MSHEGRVIMGTTRRGAPKPSHNGYEYICDRINPIYTNYRCSEKKLKCLARIQVFNKPPYRIKQLPRKGHCHPPKSQEQIETEQSWIRKNTMPNQIINNIQQESEERERLPNDEGLAARLQVQNPYHSFLVEEEELDHQPRIEGLASQLVNTSWLNYPTMHVDPTSSSANLSEGRTPMPVLANSITSRLEVSPKESTKACLINREPRRKNASVKVNNTTSNSMHSQQEKEPKNYIESFQQFCQRDWSGKKTVYREYSPTNTSYKVTNKIVKIQSTKEKTKPRSLAAYKKVQCRMKSPNKESVSSNKEKEHQNIFSKNRKIYASPQKLEIDHQPSVAKIIHRKKIYESDLKNNSTLEEYLISKIRGEPQYSETYDLNMTDTNIPPVGRNKKMGKIEEELKSNERTIDKQERDFHKVNINHKPTLCVNENYATATEISHNIMEPPTKKRKLPPLRSIYDKTNRYTDDNKAFHLKNTKENTNNNEKIMDEKEVPLKNTGNNTINKDQIIASETRQLKNTEEYINKSIKVIHNNELEMKNTNEYSKFSDAKLNNKWPIVRVERLKFKPGQVVNIKENNISDGIEDITIKMEPIDSTDVCVTSTDDINIKIEDIIIKPDVIKEENENIYDVDGVSLEMINTKKNLCQNIMKTLHKIANISSEMQTYFNMDSSKGVVDVESDTLEFDSDNLNQIEDVILSEVQKVRKVIALQEEMAHKVKENILISKEKLHCNMELMTNQIDILNTSNKLDNQESILRNLLCTSNDKTANVHLSRNKIQNKSAGKLVSVQYDKKKMPPLKSIYETMHINSNAKEKIKQLPTRQTNIEEPKKATCQIPIQQNDYKRCTSKPTNSTLTNDKKPYPKFVKISSHNNPKSNKGFGRKINGRSISEYHKQCKEIRTVDSQGFINSSNTDISIGKNYLPNHGIQYNNISNPPNLVIEKNYPHVDFLKEHDANKTSERTILKTNYESNLTKNNDPYSKVPLHSNLIKDINKSSAESSKHLEKSKREDSSNFQRNCDTDILIEKNKSTQHNEYHSNTSLTPNQIIDIKAASIESFKQFKPNIIKDKNCYVSDKALDLCPVCKTELDFTLYLDMQIMTALCICNLNITVLLDPEKSENYIENTEQNVLRSQISTNCQEYRMEDELQLSKNGYSEKKILRNLLCPNKNNSKDHCDEEKRSECEAKPKPLKKRKMPPLYSIYDFSKMANSNDQNLKKVQFPNSNTQYNIQPLKNVQMNSEDQIPLDCTKEHLQPNANSNSFKSSCNLEVIQNTENFVTSTNVKSIAVIKESHESSTHLGLEISNASNHKIGDIEKPVHSDVNDDTSKNKNLSEDSCHKFNEKKNGLKKPKEIVEETEDIDLSDDLKNFAFEKLESAIKSRLRGPTIWEFLVRLLLKPETNPRLLRWESEEMYILRLIKPDCLARLWNSRGEHVKKVPYKNFARGIRYWYGRGGIEVVKERQLVYQLGPRAISYMKKLQEREKPS